MPPEQLQEFGPMVDQLRLIAVGEMATAVLLIIPYSSSLGVLLASSFWGGAICFHMRQGDSYILVAVLLVMTWVGAYLRNPAVLASFAGRGVSPANAAPTK
jgi:hypothetical protein